MKADKTSSNDFQGSVTLTSGEMKAGNYTILVDPIWNESANLDPDFKKVLIDIYCPEILDLHAVPDQTGIKLLEKTFALIARKSEA